MEIIVFERPEMAERIGCREKLAAKFGIRLHRTAGIHQQQQLDGVFARTFPFELYLAVTSGATLGLAALSWHWVEHPALGFKPTTRTASVKVTAGVGLLPRSG